MKIENTKYERDINSKAILNTNRNALENYKAARKRKEDEIDVINSMREEIERLKKLVNTLIEK